MNARVPRHTLRLATFGYLGYYRYLLTCCTHRRRPVFTETVIVEGVRSHLLHAAHAEQFVVLAYCFMPDHLHLVVAGDHDASDCQAFLCRFKQTSGYWFARTRSERLWQRSAYDRVLRSDDDIDVAVTYVLMNPVRAGLVEDPAAYPFSEDRRGCPAG